MDATRHPEAEPPSVHLRTPHAAALGRLLEARDIPHQVEGEVVRVFGTARDDLGWLAASAGVVVYELVDDPPGSAGG